MAKETRYELPRRMSPGWRWAILLGFVLWLGIGPGKADEQDPMSAGLEVMTLDQALALALERNRDLAGQGRTVRASVLTIDSARADFSFRMTPEGNAGVSGDGDRVAYGVRLTRPTALGTEVSAAAGYRSERISDEVERQELTIFDLQVSQPLFRNYGTLIHRERLIQAGQGYRAALRNYERAKAGLVLEVVETFQRIRLLERQIETDLALVRRSERLAALTRARERQGRATHVDRLRVDLQRGEAQARLAASQERLMTTRQAFAELLGAPPSRVYELEALPEFRFEVPGMEDAVGIALSNRMDYAQVLDAIDDAERGTRIARRERLPDLSLVAQHAWIEGDRSETDWFVGLAAGSGFNVAQQNVTVARARLSYEDAVENAHNAALVIARQVQQQIISYQSAQVEKSIEERNLLVAERRAELASRLFEAGRGNHTSVTDAEEQLSLASVRRFDAESQATISGYRLLQVLGTLIEHPPELKPMRGQSAELSHRADNPSPAL